MFDILFIVVPIFVVSIFIFVFAMILSPKLRGRMMSRQIKATKYMLDESKNDLTDMIETGGDIFVNASKNILDEHEANLKNIVTKSADVTKDGIETTVRAIKDGITKDKVFCKHCGNSIDDDSKFCKHCGKEQ